LWTALRIKLLCPVAVCNVAIRAATRIFGGPIDE